MSTRRPIVKAAMVHLAANWPQAVSFATLLASVKHELGPSHADTMRSSEHQLAAALLECYANRMVELSVRPSPFTSEVSEAPLTSTLVRYQAQTSQAVTNLRHEQVKLTDLQRHILRYLDGQHNHDAVLDRAVEQVKQDTLLIHDSGQLVSDDDRIRRILRDALPECLKQLARSALFLR